MNQIAATIVISYGTAFASKYIVNKITDKITDKVVSTTTGVISGSVQTVLGRPQNNKPIEYEYILLDKDDIIIDEIKYVTSKEKRPSIDQSWTDLY